MNAQQLIDTARLLVADDKGLLAMDESNPTCGQQRKPCWARLSRIIKLAQLDSRNQRKFTIAVYGDV